MSCNPHLVLCHQQHLCCPAAELVCWNNTAGVGLAGSSATELVVEVEPRPPSSGSVPAGVPVLCVSFLNREKLNYCRSLLLARWELYLVGTCSDVLSARGRSKGGGVFCSKAGCSGFVGGNRHCLITLSPVLLATE